MSFPKRIIRSFSSSLLNKKKSRNAFRLSKIEYLYFLFSNFLIAYSTDMLWNTRDKHLYNSKMSL